MPSWHCADASACLRPGRSLSWPSGPPRRGFPADLRRGRWALVAPRLICRCRLRAARSRAGMVGRIRLPAGLGDARELTAVRHRPEADPAQAESAVDRAGPPAPGAPGIRPYLVLRRALGLGDQALLRHYSALLERETKPSQ